MRHEREYIEAIVVGDDARLEELLAEMRDDGALVDLITDRKATNHSIGYGMTLLQLASIRERPPGKPARLLVEHGATIDIHSACGMGLTQSIEHLYRGRSGIIDDQIDSYVPLQYAITSGRAEVVESLVRLGDDVNRELDKVAYFGWEDNAIGQDYVRWRPIHMASLWCFNKRRLLVVEALLAAGADVDAISPLDGYRSIHLAAMSDRAELVQLLVDRGVDIDSRTEACRTINLPHAAGPIEGHEWTALLVAAAEGFVNTTKGLLELGADPGALNSEGHTALNFAKRRFWEGQPYDSVIDLLN